MAPFKHDPPRQTIRGYLPIQCAGSEEGVAISHHHGLAVNGLGQLLHRHQRRVTHGCTMHRSLLCK
jgi:hypothetical protein